MSNETPLDQSRDERLVDSPDESQINSGGPTVGPAEAAPMGNADGDDDATPAPVNDNDDDDAPAGDGPAGADDDLVTLNSSGETIIGDDGDNLLEGGDGDDLIIGGGGDDTISGGAGDDTLIGGRDEDDPDSGNDQISGGEGDDLIFGGGGDDTLFGGAGNDTIFGGDGNDFIVGGSGGDGLEDYTVTITFEGGTADFKNSLGFYYLDPVTGAFSNVQFAFPNASPEGPDGLDGGGELIPGESSFSVPVPPGAIVGTFLVADGFDLNDGYEGLDFDNGSLKFVNAEGQPAGPGDTDPQLIHVAPDGTETPINGPVYHSFAFDENLALNPDGKLHLEGISENADGSWTFGFEDLPNLGDQDFDDVIFSIDLANSGATFPNPFFDASSTLIDGDPSGGNLLDGGAGNDLIVTGAGQDTVDAGKGDDTIFAGPGDFVDGGEGFDALVIRDWEHIVARDIKTETDPETGISTLSGWLVYKDPDDPDAPLPEFGGVYGDDLVPDGNLRTMQFKNINAIVPCFTPGTSIATPEGERLVETLQVGDRIISRDNGLQEIRWIGARKLDWATLNANTHLRPILIEKGALGNGLPERDMLVSPQHRVLVANERTQLYFDEHEVLVAAKHLVNHHSIREVAAPGVTYVHFMCERHEVVLSNGAWTETFQPGDQTLKSMGNAQRLELFELFPELSAAPGREGYTAARKSLKRHEARLLVNS